MNYTAIILAGGKSSRMGMDKGFCKIHNRPMIQHVIDIVSKVQTTDCLIISNNPEYKIFGQKVYPDIYPDKGPLGGIFTGLAHSKTSNNLVLSCDIPFINTSVLHLLMNQHVDNEINVVKFENKIHPLIGTYKTTVHKDIEAHILQNKLKMKDFLKAQGAHYLDLDKELPNLSSQVFENINSPNELSKYE